MAVHHRRTTLRAMTAIRLRQLSLRQWRDVLSVLVPALLLVIGAFWLASRYVEPAPPRTITITTGSPAGAYYATGQRYAQILRRSGVTLEVRSSEGSVENVRRLLDPKSGVQVALLQGGTTNSTESPGIVSLGRVYVEPMWVFYRGDRTVDRLSQLKGRRLSVGAEGSGTRALALALLKPNAIDAENTTLVAFPDAFAVEAIAKGEIDAAFFTSAVDAPQIQMLLRMPELKLMSLSRAEAYTRIFPYLSRILLPKGTIDLSEDIPLTDVEMVAPMAALVAREDLHPALVGLLVQAAKEVHSAGGIFHHAGDFPKPNDPEFELSPDADRIYKSGPPFLQRYLPFWVATYIERAKVLILPIAVILLPAIRLAPVVYNWRVRRRLLYWYEQIRELEHEIANDPERTRLDEHRSDMARIERGVETMPLHEQYYMLLAAIDHVRNRLA